LHRAADLAKLEQLKAQALEAKLEATDAFAQLEKKVGEDKGLEGMVPQKLLQQVESEKAAALETYTKLKQKTDKQDKEMSKHMIPARMKEKMAVEELAVLARKNKDESLVQKKEPAMTDAEVRVRNQELAEKQEEVNTAKAESANLAQNAKYAMFDKLLNQVKAEKEAAKANYEKLQAKDSKSEALLSKHISAENLAKKELAGMESLGERIINAQGQSLGEQTIPLSGTSKQSFDKLLKQMKQAEVGPLADLREEMKAKALELTKND